MPIKRCFARKVDFFMGGHLWNPKVKFPKKEVIFVFVEMDSGECGVGEIWSAYGVPDTVVHIINHDFSPLLAGENPHEIESIRRKIHGLAPMAGQPSSCISTCRFAGESPKR